MAYGLMSLPKLFELETGCGFEILYRAADGGGLRDIPS